MYVCVRVCAHAHSCMCAFIIEALLIVSFMLIVTLGGIDHYNPCTLLYLSVPL